MIYRKLTRVNKHPSCRIQNQHTKAAVFLYTNTEHLMEKIKTTIPFTIASKIKQNKQKPSGINLTKEAKCLYT